MKGFISDRTNNAITLIVARAFNGNALFDNIHYNLDVVFNMPVANDIVHLRVAHWLPAPFADDIQDFQSRRGVKPSRPMVEPQSKTYESYVDCFSDALEYFRDLESDFKNAIKIADEDSEIESRIFLENTYMDVLKFTKQMMIWKEKAIEYDNNADGYLFDTNFESFTII